MPFPVEFGHDATVYPVQNGVTSPNSEQPIRLPNGLLYPRVEVEQRTHSWDEIEQRTHSARLEPGISWYSPFCTTIFPCALVYAAIHY